MEMTEEIKGVLESLSWVFGSGSCSVGLRGQPREFRGHRRQVHNFLSEMKVSIGDSVIVTVDDIGQMVSIRKMAVCPKCGSGEIEEERVKDCLYWSCLCSICGHSWIEE